MYSYIEAAESLNTGSVTHASVFSNPSKQNPFEVIHTDTHNIQDSFI